MVELPSTQLRLVDLRLHLRDRSLYAAHAFPFVDAHWRVAFILFELHQLGLRVLRDRVDARPEGFVSHAASDALERPGAMSRQELAGLVHFDPWWILKTAPQLLYERGSDGSVRVPDPAWVEAVKATNIAVRFRHEGRRYTVEDVQFDSGLRRAEAVVARGRFSARRMFRYGELELLRLRRPAPRA